MFNTPFYLGDVDVNYTSAKVVESFTGANAAVTAAWFPVYTGVREDGTVVPGGAPEIVSITTAAGVAVDVANDASITVGADGKTLTISNGTGTAISATDVVKVKYIYDNVVIPQNDLPLLNAEMDNIALFAKPRRIAIKKLVA